MKITIEEIKAERKLLHCSLRDAHRSIEKKNLLQSINNFQDSKNVREDFANMFRDMVDAIYH